MIASGEFEDFVVEAEPRLRRALIGAVGIDRVDDAVAEALAYAFQNWARVGAMANPVGYLFRVAQSRSRLRKAPRLFRAPDTRVPDVEPRLTQILLGLPRSQRTAVWLAHACDWSHGEIAEALNISSSTVATHVNRAMTRLRNELGVVDAHH